ncbi:unnamed protein product [Rhizophagus irregularis]|nr:unnamed protein product [Rhizophagus irregularis]
MLFNFIFYTLRSRYTVVYLQFASVAHFQDPKHKKIERNAVTGAQTDGQNWASQFFASEEKGQYKDVYAKNRWPKIGPTSFSLQKSLG